MKGGVPFFLRPRGLAACDANFFFSHGRRLSALYYVYMKGLSALYPLQGGEGGIASLNDLTKSRNTLRYRPALRCSESAFDVSCASPACLYVRRQRPFFLSDGIASRSAPRGGQTQAGRTSEPTATPYHTRYNDRHGEPAPRSRRRPAATQGGKVIPREGAKHTLRHEIRRENTATHRDASARYVLRDGRAYAAASCHGTQEVRTAFASSEGFGRVGIGQGLKTGTRRLRCSYSKASPDSALLIQRVRFLRKFLSSSRSSVICEENDNGVRAPQGFRQRGPATPTCEIRYRYNTAQPVRPRHVRVAHRNGHPVPIVTNPRTRQMPAAPSPRFAKKPYGFAPRGATRRGTVPPAISRCNRETGYDAKRDGCTVHHGARYAARPYVHAPKTRHPSLRMCYDPA